MTENDCNLCFFVFALKYACEVMKNKNGDFPPLNYKLIINSLAWEIQANLILFYAHI